MTEPDGTEIGPTSGSSAGDLISKLSEQSASFVRYELQAETETTSQALGNTVNTSETVNTGETAEPVEAVAAKADVKPRLGAQADEINWRLHKTVSDGHGNWRSSPIVGAVVLAVVPVCVLGLLVRRGGRR